MERINSPENLMAPEFDVEEIAAVPTIEIARWTVRIARTNFALRMNNYVVKGGDTDMSDDGGSIYQYLSDQATAGSDWESLPAYEDAVIYEMKPKLGYREIMQAPYRQIDSDRYGDGAVLAMEMQRSALRKGLGRIGLYVSDEPHIPIGAAAAAYYQRASVKSPVDRTLYERQSEIDTAALELGRLVPSPTGGVERKVLVPPSLTQSGKWEERTEMLPIYAISREARPEEVRALGLVPDSPLDPWWQELQRDLGRIDELSRQL